MNYVFVLYLYEVLGKDKTKAQHRDQTAQR